MSTIDHDLARVRADLRAAVQRDIRRRTRRRRIARLVIIPAVVLTSVGAAIAFASQLGEPDLESTAGPAIALTPQLGDPAPKSLTARLDRDLARMRERVAPKVADRINGPDGRRLTLAAIGEYTLIYGAVQPSGAWCAVDTTTTGRLQGWVCHEASKAGRPDEVIFTSSGGGWTRAHNIVAGRVGQPSARTMRIHVPGPSEPVVTPVQRLGFFIAQLPDSTLRSQQHVALFAEALDADGKVVATSSEPLGG
jgi:hypothetical protein